MRNHLSETFVGRKKELGLLEKAFHSSRAELVAIYGRRRIGKSALVEEFSKDKKDCFFKFEGLEGEHTQAQIKHFMSTLSQRINEPYLKKTGFTTWEDVFSFLTEKIIKHGRSKKKLILFFDELQWMSASQKKLISIIKYYWDNYWKESNVMLILCGSIASFMIDKVIKSKALYGRMTLEILLHALKPHESKMFFKNKRSKEEILKYLMIFGGVPKYLEIIDLHKSFNQNLNDLCFSANGYMINECEKIFYSQFREKQVYLKIVKMLKEKGATFNEISTKVELPPSGGLKRYLTNLENAEIISGYNTSTLLNQSKVKKYKLSDEYLVFYFKYIEPNLPIIKKHDSKHLFYNLCEKKWQPWLGFAFERFCYKNALYLASQMGFYDEVLDFSSYITRESGNAQIDLLYIRSDKVITLCEIKYQDRENGTDIIPEVERKTNLLPKLKGYTLEKALISLHGPDRSLLQSKYFHHILTLNDVL